jgi:hypothetical protein
MVGAVAGLARGVGVSVASTAGVVCGVEVGVAGVGWVSWVVAVAGVATAVSRLGWELVSL